MQIHKYDIIHGDFNHMSMSSLRNKPAVLRPVFAGIYMIQRCDGLRAGRSTFEPGLYGPACERDDLNSDVVTVFSRRTSNRKQ